MAHPWHIAPTTARADDDGSPTDQGSATPPTPVAGAP
jgi:hypothetical protein